MRAFCLLCNFVLVLTSVFQKFDDTNKKLQMEFRIKIFEVWKEQQKICCKGYLQKELTRMRDKMK